MKTRISEKGQVTVPKACRDRLGLKPGTVVECEAVGGNLIMRKVSPVDKFHKWRGRGKLPGGASVDDYLSKVRG
jgi:AbrB family looped-hinge helix DNA binding protein